MQLLAGIGPLGLPELAIVLVIVILIFGVGRLPEVGGAIGKGIREFRHATKDDENAATTSSASMDAGTTTDVSAPASPPETASQPAAASDTIYCAECGARNPRSAKFCAECGKAIAAPVS